MTAETTDPRDAEITRLRAELAEARKPDLRTVMGFEAGEAHAAAEIERLRAEVAELRARETRLVGAIRGLYADFGLAVMAIKRAEDEATMRAVNAIEASKP